jgi:hypothetical protein
MSVTDLAKAGAELAETVRKLIAPFLEPVLSEAGLYVAEKIRFVRFQNSLRVLERASQLLANYGINPKAVDLKLLVPILEGAGLEDNDDLIEKWSGLLASAASGGEVLPAFARILGELGPDEAKILDHTADHSKRLEVMAGDVYAIDLRTLRQNTLLSMDEFSIRLLNLDRLGLVELITTGGHRFGMKYYGDSDLDSVGLTRLGRALVQACRGPKRIKDVSAV